MKVLAINTYGGSLLLGARAAGFTITGSFEDSGFGSDIQAANFPDVELVRHIADWPSRDLRDTVVIAHPPCSAFSVQNTVTTTRGANSNAFACTKRVLDYAMRNNAAAIAIESVVGALSGAWNVHQQYADSYGYHVYRVLQNGITFGPQWRERFWVVFVKKNAAPATWRMSLEPNFQTVSDVLGDHEDDEVSPMLEKQLAKQKERLRPLLNDEELARLFEPQDPPYPTIPLGRVLWKMKFDQPGQTVEDRMKMWSTWIGGFASGQMVYLGPNDYCPVLMSGSHWYYRGKNVGYRGYRRLMGFPADYIFPTGTGRNYLRMQNMYLSKGVIPAVARWVLEQVGAHLGFSDTPAVTDAAYHREARPNQVTDFRIKNRDVWRTRELERPLLRDDDDDLSERLYEKAQEEEMTSTVRTVLETAKTALMSMPVLDTDGNIEAIRTEALEAIEKTLAPPPPEPIPGKKKATKSASSGERKAPVRIPKTVRIEPASTEGLEKKRLKIVELVRDQSIPTLDAAITLCMEHPELRVKYATARWHVTQLVKSGHLREVSHVQ